jgi:hypothetical protein
MFFVTSLCVRLLSSRCSDGAGAELQHGDGGVGREGDYCERQQEEFSSLPGQERRGRSRVSSRSRKRSRSGTATTNVFQKNLNFM